MKCKKKYDPTGSYTVTFAVDDFIRAKEMVGIDKEAWDKLPIIDDIVFGDAKNIPCRLEVEV